MEDCDLYQTMYFPGAGFVYRASITGNKLIVEFIADPDRVGVDLVMIGKAFGIDYINRAIPIDKGDQKYGKIIDINPDIRRSIMSSLTHELDIYSLGRYATWRNILLDDVFEDIIKIRDLMKLDSYSRRLQL